MAGGFGGHNGSAFIRSGSFTMVRRPPNTAGLPGRQLLPMNMQIVLLLAQLKSLLGYTFKSYRIVYFVYILLASPATSNSSSSRMNMTSKVLQGLLMAEYEAAAFKGKLHWWCLYTYKYVYKI